MREKERARARDRTAAPPHFPPIYIQWEREKGREGERKRGREEERERGRARERARVRAQKKERVYLAQPRKPLHAAWGWVRVRGRKKERESESETGYVCV